MGNTNNEKTEPGPREIGTMLSALDESKRGQRKCVICLEVEWMDPGESICWKCNRCRQALKTLAHPLTQESSPEDQALHEVITWMQDVPPGQERSVQEIENHLASLRTSYAWSADEQYTRQDSYQDGVINFLLLALHDMNLFFRRLSVVREYSNRLGTTKE